MQFSFAYKKAIQSLNYFAQQEGGEINKMKALKLIYFADRYHLRKYGRPITNDTYFALRFGPVASACKDLLNTSDASKEFEYKEAYLNTEDRYLYSSKVNIEQDQLSKTDREALCYASETYSRQNQYELANTTHEFPEWKKHKAALDSGLAGRRAMPYSDFLENPESGVETLEPLTPEDQEDLKEEIAELHAIESVWT